MKRVMLVITYPELKLISVESPLWPDEDLEITQEEEYQGLPEHLPCYYKEEEK
jgi:hypothetical protein